MNRKFRRAFDRSVSDAIKRGGRQVMRVCPAIKQDEIGEPYVEKPVDIPVYGFAYTIENAAKSLPELLILGVWAPAIGSVLHKLSDKLVERGRAFLDGEEVYIGGKFPVKIINADQRAQHDYTCAATGRFGAGNYTVQQVLAPDLNGRFPGDPDCCPPYNTPVLRSPAGVH
jgi:hypothetical protein